MPANPPALRAAFTQKENTMKTNKAMKKAERDAFVRDICNKYSWIERDEYAASIDMRVTFLRLEGAALAKQLFKEYPHDIVKYVMNW